MLKPRLDLLLVLPDSTQSLASELIHVIQSKGITESQKQLGRVGRVVATGPGKYNKKGDRIPMTVCVGDRVTWGEFAFPEYHDGCETYAIISEADITGIVE